MLSKNPEIAKAHALIADYVRLNSEMPLTAVSARFGISMAWLYRIMRDHGVHRYKQGNLAQLIKTNPELFEVEGVK